MHTPVLAATEPRLVAIWIKRFKRGPMDPVDAARLVAGRGIVGNANQGGRRQVTIIERELWNAMMTRLGADLSPSTRRANLMVQGMPLKGTVGGILRVGAVRIRIFNETKPCERMDEALPGLKREMSEEWRGGVFGEVLDDGEIKVGDEVGWSEEEDSTAAV